MPKLNPSSRPEVSVTFRMSEMLYEELLDECGRCQCSVSSVVRYAVIREIADRNSRRKAAASGAVLTGQMTIEDVSNA